jgi:hypothetical protein
MAGVALSSATARLFEAGGVHFLAEAAIANLA